jgi:ABC-2 type transport system permease protein
MPAIVFPQLLLCGLLVPRERMAGWLETASDVLPLTYAFDALQRVTTLGSFDDRVAADVGVTLGVTALALALAATTLRRRTA